MQVMRVMRDGLSATEPSVLNPALTQLKAWGIVWDALVSGHTSMLIPGQAPLWHMEPGTATWVLSPWLEKRVKQVCLNRIEPEVDVPATQLLNRVTPGETAARASKAIDEATTEVISKPMRRKLL